MGKRPVAPILALAFAAVSGCTAFAQPRDDMPTLQVASTLFRVVLPGGHILTSPDLVGAVLEVAAESGQLITVRIDAVLRPVRGCAEEVQSRAI